MTASPCELSPVSTGRSTNSPFCCTYTMFPLSLATTAPEGTTKQEAYFSRITSPRRFIPGRMRLRSPPASAIDTSQVK